MKFNELAQPIFKVFDRLDGAIELDQQVLGGLLAQQKEQLLLAVDVVVQRTRLDTDFLGEHPQVHRAVAVFGEQLDCRGAQVAQRFRTVRAGFPHRYSGPPLIPNTGVISLSTESGPLPGFQIVPIFWQSILR
jgi:hypothetical protein